MSSKVHILGVRHHGPGSARSVVRALEALRPDVVLIEGPPDANAALPLMADEAMQPPVALLVYVSDEPRRAAFYPFARFSPEWQAARFAMTHGVEVRFIDLPQWHQLVAEEEDVAANGDELGPQASPTLAAVRRDPLGHLAEAAGFADGETWWDHMVESRDNDADLFAAIAEAMTSLRAGLDQEAYWLSEDEAMRERRREAHMRRCIREAISAGRERVAVICGAWHVPALADMPAAKHDNELLKGLKKVKTEVAWSPWTYERLAFMSGYGAGVRSPEWYHLLWDIKTDGNDRAPLDPVTVWLTRVARLMREKDLDASSSHVIESVRLAQTLSTMRGRMTPGLNELNEAALTVVCNGETAPLGLIHRELVVGNRIGAVPAHAPMPPLQRDLQRQQTSLRLKPTSEVKDLDLDLRKENDLARSHLLHRLNLLGVTWGSRHDATHRSTGTFHEHWQIQWEPTLAVAVVEASRYGPTVAEAASAKVTEAAAKSERLADLTAMLDDGLLADLPDAVARLVSAIATRAATAADVNQLLDAIPALARVCRYGNVRQTDATVVGQVLDEMLTRACIGLTNACSGLNDEAAQEMYGRVVRVNNAVANLDQPQQHEQWLAALRHVARMQDTNGLIIGRAARLLYDRGATGPDDMANEMSLRLSPGVEAAAAAAWLEGFLRGSGLVLIHDEKLFALISMWIAGLSDERFNDVLPLVRRTFSTFEPAERRHMGQRVRSGAAASDTAQSTTSAEFDFERAAPVLDTLDLIFGVAKQEPS